jgi:hypothetical protein
MEIIAMIIIDMSKVDWVDRILTWVARMVRSSRLEMARVGGMKHPTVLHDRATLTTGGVASFASAREAWGRIVIHGNSGGDWQGGQGAGGTGRKMPMARAMAMGGSDSGDSGQR